MLSGKHDFNVAGGIDPYFISDFTAHASIAILGRHHRNYRLITLTMRH